MQVFGLVSSRNYSVPGISDKSILYPIGIYEISVQFRFGLGFVSLRFRIHV